jgi:lysophospholipase L1-like esterase
MATTATFTPADFYDRMMREADPVSWTTFNSAAVATVTGAINTTIATAQGSNTVCKAVWVEEITVSLSAPGIAQVQMPASSDGLFAGFLKQVIVGTTPVTIPVRQIVRGFTHGNNMNITLAVRNNLTAGGVDYFGAISASGWRISDDLDFSAPKTVLIISDSTLNGTGPTKTALAWAFLFKKHLRDEGVRARILLKSVSSVKTTDMEGYRAAGYLDIPKADLILYNVGINDAGAAVSDGTYTTNITAFWDWASMRFPSAKAIICGVSPLENNTSETRAVGLRTAASTYVSGVASAKLKFIDLGSAFDRTVSSNYASTDTPGSRVHPSDAGHASLATTFNAAYDALDLTL